MSSRLLPLWCLFALNLSGEIGKAQSERTDRSVILGGDGFAIECILLDPGTFQQGSPTEESDRKDDETPREVILTRPFLLGKYPVTVGEFRQFIQETGYRTEAEKGDSGGFGWNGTELVQKPEYNWKNPGFPQTDRHPVTLVTWFDAKEYCKWLGRKVRRSISLPSEAQWEYACRAGSAAVLPIGIDANHVMTSTTHPKGTEAVDSGPRNEWGLIDMPGNAWEWCEDWYAPYAPGSVRDPLQQNANLSDKPRRVLRGGSFLKGPSNARSASRFRNDPRSRNADNGFRIMTFDLEEKPIPQKAASPPKPSQSAVTASAPPTPLPKPKSNNPSPPRTPSAPSSNSIAKGLGVGFQLLFCPMVAVGIVILVIKLLSSGKSSKSRQLVYSSSESSLSDVFAVRPDSEGFWVRSGVAPGTMLRWRGLVGGQWVQSEFPYLGAAQGQYIGTGSSPSSVTVEIASASPSKIPIEDPAPEPLRPPREVPEYRRPHRRPSAY